MSTVVLARLLRQRRDGGTVVALEHDAAWAELVTDTLRRESLAEFARVVHAPLEGEPPWYSRAAVPDDRVDLLIVDGPPAYQAGHGRRREPALAVFESLLTPDATVVLDDVDRPGEQQVLAAWRERPNWDFVVDEAAGLAVGTRPVPRAASNPVPPRS